MIKSRWYTHPLFIFLFSLVALATSLFIYIRSYLKVYEAFEKFVVKYNFRPEQFVDSQTWVLIVILSLLVGIIFFGMFLTYLFYNKVVMLYRLQHNFINGFTHELKTPIASIRLFLDTFKKYDLSREDQLKYLEYMIKDTERLKSNVDQILNLGRIEDRQYRPDFSRTSVYSFIEDFVVKNPHLFEQLKVEIRKLHTGDYMSLIDKNLFEILLMNLFSNAVRYQSDKAPKISIVFSIQGKEMVIKISDNGIGIDKTQQKKVFKKFYQIGKSVKGSGIGLYMCSQVMKLHKGNIRVESEGAGLGSTFILSLPIGGEA